MADCGFECKSIELSKELYAAAEKTFSGYKNVELFCGDSGEMLGQMVDRAEPPYLFWLDGHYSKGVTAKGIDDTPIMRELDQLRHRDLSESTILIDDIRDFGRGEYPPITYLEAYVRAFLPNHVYEVYGDIMRVTPRMGLGEKLTQLNI